MRVRFFMSVFFLMVSAQAAFDPATDITDRNITFLTPYQTLYSEKGNGERLQKYRAHVRLTFTVSSASSCPSCEMNVSISESQTTNSDSLTVAHWAIKNETTGQDVQSLKYNKSFEQTTSEKNISVDTYIEATLGNLNLAANSSLANTLNVTLQETTP